MPGDTTVEGRTDAETDPIVVEFKSRDELKPQKPDHDPHGESGALAAHSWTGCSDCEASGLVPTTTLEAAAGFIGDRPEREVVCEECG